MICHVTVHTPNAMETVAFYQWLLDLPIVKRIPTPQGDIVFMGTHETKFEIIPDSDAERINTKSISVGFTVASLDEKIGLLDQKGIHHSPVISPVPAMRFVFFTDMNGCEIQLCEETENDKM